MDDLTRSEAHTRVSLARSILNHRPATARNIDLAIAALEGTTLQDLAKLDSIEEAA